MEEVVEVEERATSFQRQHHLSPSSVTDSGFGSSSPTSGLGSSSPAPVTDPGFGSSSPAPVTDPRFGSSSPASGCGSSSPAPVTDSGFGSSSPASVTDSGFGSSSPCSPLSLPDSPQFSVPSSCSSKDGYNALDENESSRDSLLSEASCSSSSSFSPGNEQPAITKHECHCQWGQCEENFSTDNHLFDHVMLAHIRNQQPGQTVITRNRTGRRPSTELRCGWAGCGMKLVRGDYVKQYHWLEEHFTARHSGRAQPYPCLIQGCHLRFPLKRSLEDHLRNGHDGTSKRMGRVSGKRHQLCITGTGTETLTKCLSFVPINYSVPGMDFLDTGTSDEIVDRLAIIDEKPSICLDLSSICRANSHQKRGRLSIFAPVHEPSTPKVSTSLSIAETVNVLNQIFGKKKPS